MGWKTGRNEDVERLREAGVAIRFAPILDAFARLQAQADVLVVEGAGGFRVPLGAEGDSAQRRTIHRPAWSLASPHAAIHGRPRAPTRSSGPGGVVVRAA